MKKIILFAVLSLFSALLLADFNEDFVEYQGKSIWKTIDGSQYWVTNGFLFSDEDAIELAAERALILLKAKAGWESPTLEEHKELVKAAAGVGAIKMVMKDRSFWLLSITMDKVLEKFNNPEFKKMKQEEQLSAIQEYLAKEGSWSEYKS